MKHTTIKLFAIGLFIYGSATLAVEDYSRYSNEELMGMRGQVREMNMDERNAYREERRKRMQAMSKEERQAMREKNRETKMKDKGKEYGSGAGNRQGGKRGQ